jgi:hypothetical protein
MILPYSWPERRGAREIRTQTRRAIPHLLQAAGSVISCQDYRYTIDARHASRRQTSRRSKRSAEGAAQTSQGGTGSPHNRKCLPSRWASRARCTVRSTIRFRHSISHFGVLPSIPSSVTSRTSANSGPINLRTWTYHPLAPVTRNNMYQACHSESD